MSSEELFEPQKSPSERPGQRGGARARNRAARTQGLCEAALGLFLTRGVERVTIDEITKAAGVSKGSYYRYFDDKTHLVRTLMDPVRDAMLEPLTRALAQIEQADSPDTLMGAYEVLATELVPVLLQHAPLVQLYLHARQGPDHEARAPFVELSTAVTELAVRMTTAAQEHGLLAPVDPRVSARVVLGATHELLLAVLRGEDVGDPAAVAHAVVQIIVHGVAAR